MRQSWFDGGYERYEKNRQYVIAGSNAKFARELELFENNNISKDIMPTKEALDFAVKTLYYEFEKTYAAEIINVIKSKDINEIYTQCIRTVEWDGTRTWRGTTLFKLITGKDIRYKNKKEALNMIKEYAGKEKVKEYEQKLNEMKIKEKEVEEQKKKEKAEKEKKETIKTLTDRLSVRRSVEERQKLAENIYNWTYTLKPLTRGKILKYITSNKDVRYVINGSYRRGSRLDFVYDTIKDEGYNIIDKENKSIENKDGYVCYLTATDFLIAEHLINSFF